MTEQPPGPSTWARPRPEETFEEFQERYRASVPPVVYLPTVQVVGPDEPVQVELRTTSDDRVALLAYSALDRLVDCCGPHQPFAVVRTEALEEIRASQPFDVVHFDLAMPDELRRRPTDDGPGDAAWSGDAER